jgi:hypothetical protein
LAWDEKGDRTGQGFNRSPDLSQKPVEFLAELKVFKAPDSGFLIDYSTLATYGSLYGVDSDGRSSAHMPRRKVLYQPPLVILPKAPGEDELKPKAYISRTAIAFSQSFYGYSCTDHDNPETLASVIFLLAHSTLFRYFALMMSTSQGVDFMLFTKQDFDALPVPNIQELSEIQKSELCDLARRMERDKIRPWQELDDCIFRLYGLDDIQVQAIKDTLFFVGAYRNASKAAHDLTERSNRAPFIEILRNELQPYFDVFGESVAVRESEFQPDSWDEPWFFVTVCRDSASAQVDYGLMQQAMELANRRGCSRILVNLPDKQGLLLGLLNRRRWWTITRARLSARFIIRDRLEAFGLSEGI